MPSSDRHLQSEVQKWPILGCCVCVKWPGLITVRYSGARCPSRPAGVTGCGVVAFLPEETKMQCTIGCVIWPGARWLAGRHRGNDPSATAAWPALSVDGLAGPRASSSDPPPPFQGNVSSSVDEGVAPSPFCAIFTPATPSVMADSLMTIGVAAIVHICVVSVPVKREESR